MIRQILFLFAALCSISSYAQADFPEGVNTTTITASGQVTLPLTPVNTTHAASKGYVDSSLTGKTDKSLNIDFPKSYIAPFSPGNFRNTEGDIIVLTNGRYLSAYTAFHQGQQDDAPARIVYKISTDNTGMSWGNEVELSKNIGALNVISVSLIRISSTVIHCYFLVRNSATDLQVYRSISSNDGTTWAAATSIISGNYNIVLNGTVRRGNSNRIIMPIMNVPDPTVGSPVWNISCYYSDNDGTSFTQSNIVTTPTAQGEVSFVSLGGNNLRLVIRTTSGFVYFSDSTNNGTTWGSPYASTLSSDPAPTQIINYSGTLIAIGNPNSGTNNRNPLTIRKSTDLGATWTTITDLENYLSGSVGVRYAYPSITVDGANMLVTYYELAVSTGGGISQKFTKINIPDLLAGIKPSVVDASGLTVGKMLLDSTKPVRPGNTINEAISTLQNQIDDIKGRKFSYTGLGDAATFTNIDPLSNMGNLYMTWYNTNASTVMARLGFLNTTYKFYILSPNNVIIQAPGIEHNGPVTGTSTAAYTGTVSGGVATAPTHLPQKLYVDTQDALKAPINNATFTGDTQVVTPAASDNDTSVPTTAWVKANAIPYKVYTAILTQTGTGAPTATVLENTLGTTITWTRTGTGAYSGTAGLAVFTANKTFLPRIQSPSIGQDVILVKSSTTVIGITTSNNLGAVSDTILSNGGADGNSCIEIRVYN